LQFLYSSFDSWAIATDEHERWLAERLSDERTLLLVADTSPGLPVGKARFEHRDGSWRLDYSIGPEFRELGLAAKMLGSALEQLRHRRPDARLRSEVKLSNAAARRTLARLGFREAATADNRSVYESP